MMNLKSILIDTDAYKVSMWEQYPPGTEFISSYIEARKNPWKSVTFYGLEDILDVLETQITADDVEFANRYWTAKGLNFNYDGWMKIVTKYDGYLPLRVQALKEGTRLQHGNVMVQLINTDPEFFWLPTWVETPLLRVWYPTTVASLSYAIKQRIYAALELSADAPDEEILFKLHDFGSRGVSSNESAGRGGSAHLLNFMGSDTGVAAFYAMQYYNAPLGIDGSIPAAEHSTITSWGRENERKAFENMIDKFGSGLVAVVSDSYDIWNAVDNIWGKELKDRIIKMDGMLVIRPDSGDPEQVPVDVIAKLADAFGYTLNSKGYKVLNHVRVIQGDGINYDSINVIIGKVLELGFSISNIAFGMGGALLQGPNRDTMGFAMKASAAFIDGEWVEVFKDPVTDSGKRSKKGRLALVDRGEGLVTIKESQLHETDENFLNTVFEVTKSAQGVSVFRANSKWEEVVERARAA